MTPCLPDHPALAVLPDVPTREQIEAFGCILQAQEADQAPPDISTRHHMAGDVYGRSVAIPADTFVVGLPHREDHLNVCVGDITVWTDTGKVRLKTWCTGTIADGINYSAKLYPLDSLGIPG